MECPVCFEEPKVNCEFKCGHSFCYCCVRQWYQNGSGNCPMCRASMCFKGMLEMRKRWEEDMRFQTLDHVVNAEIENMMENDNMDPELLLFGMEILQRRRDAIKKLDVDGELDQEAIEYLLRFCIFSVNYLMGVRPMVYELPTYVRYLMVPQTSHGVKVK